MELQIDYQYHEYSYFCISYYQYKEITVWIHVYKNPYIIEIQNKSGDGFGYVKLICELRFLFQEKGMIQGNYKAYQDNYSIPIHVEYSPEYIRSLIDSSRLHKEDIYTLAVISLDKNMQPFMVDSYVLEMLVELCVSSDTNITRCALAILCNLLYSPDAGIVSHFLNQKHMKCIVDHIIKYTKTPQIKRECNMIYPFLEDQSK